MTNSTGPKQINRFPTVVASSPPLFTGTNADLRSHGLVLLQGLERLARTERGDSAQWRKLANQVQGALRALDGESSKDDSELGILLRQHREQAGLSQLELAKKAGVSESLVRNMEKGRSRVTKRTLARMLQVGELRMAAEHLVPSWPVSARPSAESLNWWVAPHVDAVSMLQELKLRLSSSGGRIEQTFAYLDHQSADDYLKMASEPQYVASYRMPMPVEEVAERASEVLGTCPMDLIALGPGDGEQETRFSQALVSLQGQRAHADLRLYLLDISQPLLSRAHRHAKDKLDAIRGVTVIGMWGNFHHLPLYEQIFYSPAKRRRIFTMLGFTLQNLDDEPRFFRDSLRCAVPGDLLFVDFSVVFAAADQPALIRQQDPVLNKPVPELISTWLSGPFRRYLESKEVRISYHLDVDCPVPGSYSLDSMVRVRDMFDGEKEFGFARFRRYAPQGLTKWLAGLGWEQILFRQFGPSNRSQPALMLLRKQS